MIIFKNIFWKFYMFHMGFIFEKVWNMIQSEGLLVHIKPILPLRS